MKMLTEIQYLPPVEYFVRLLQHNKLLIEANENYQKQSYRNRCYILGANKVEELSIPVKKGNSKTLIRDVEIDYSQKWLPVHWRSITSAYGKAPFFEYYAELFHEIFFKRHKFLFDLNMELLLLCLKLLQLETEIEATKEFLPVTNEIPEGINDIRGKIHPKGKEENLIPVTFVGYQQVFGKDFEENLSIIDLLFCEGSNSVQVLRGSITK